MSLGSVKKQLQGDIMRIDIRFQWAIIVVFTAVVLCPLSLFGAAPKAEELFEAVVKAVYTDEDRQAYEETVAQLRSLHDAGEHEATHYLGLALLLPQAVAFEPREGIALVRKSAKGGFHKAQVHLALLYEHGDPLYDFPKNEAQALSWWEKAAEGGSWVAMQRLAAAYENGELGVERDSALAEQWRERGNKTPCPDPAPAVSQRDAEPGGPSCDRPAG